MAQINNNMSVSRPRRSKNDFLDQINGLKRVENLFDTFQQILVIMTAHNVMKMPSNAKMTFRRRKFRFPLLFRGCSSNPSLTTKKKQKRNPLLVIAIEKNKGKWIL